MTTWLQAAHDAWDELEALRDDPGYSLVRREVIACLATRPGSTSGTSASRAREAARVAANVQAAQRAREASDRQARESDSQRMVDDADAAFLDRSVDRSRVRADAIRAEQYDAAKREAEARRVRQGLAQRELLRREQEGVAGEELGDDPEPAREGRFYSAARRLRTRLDSAITRARELARVGTTEAARRTADAAAVGLVRTLQPLAQALDGMAGGIANGVSRVATGVGVGVGVVVAGAALLYFIVNKKRK